MKLLFDNNLSLRLVKRLADVYPNATHVALIRMDEVKDEIVWEFAKTEGYLIVTKDSDFDSLSVTRGYPPKVVWLKLGNCNTKEIESLLRESHEIVLEFYNNNEHGVLVLL